MTFKTLRKRQNLSLNEAAKKIGVNFQAICRYENKGRIPSKKILKKIIEVYGCTEKELGEAIFFNLKVGENYGDERGDNEYNKRIV